MDIKNLLPLFMAGNKNADKILPIINMMGGGKNNQSGENSAHPDSAASDGGENSSSADKTQPNKPPSREEMLQALLKGNMSSRDALQAAFAERGKSRAPGGISPLLGVVNDDILGKMVKFLNRRDSHKKSPE